MYESGFAYSVMRTAPVWSLLGLLMMCGAIGAMMVTERAHAGGFRSPEECLTYAGEAHLNCLYAYIEIQQGHIAQLREEFNAQKASAGQLQDQLNRQESMSDHLRERIKDRDQALKDVRSPYWAPFFGFSYLYGSLFYYGRPFFYGHRFFGPCYGPFYSYPCW